MCCFFPSLFRCKETTTNDDNDRTPLTPTFSATITIGNNETLPTLNTNWQKEATNLLIENIKNSLKGSNIQYQWNIKVEIIGPILAALSDMYSHEEIYNILTNKEQKPINPLEKICFILFSDKQNKYMQAEDNLFVSLHGVPPIYAKDKQKTTYYCSLSDVIKSIKEAFKPLVIVQPSSLLKLKHIKELEAKDIRRKVSGIIRIESLNPEIKIKYKEIQKN